MATQRIAMAINKKTNGIKVRWMMVCLSGWHIPGRDSSPCYSLLVLQVSQKDIASLLQQEKEEKARIRVEHVIRLVRSGVDVPYAYQDMKLTSTVHLDFESTGKTLLLRRMRSFP